MKLVHNQLWGLVANSEYEWKKHFQKAVLAKCCTESHSVPITLDYCRLLGTSSVQGICTSWKRWYSGAVCIGDTLSLMDMCYLHTHWYWNFPNRFHTRTTTATRRSVSRHAQAHEPCHGPGMAELSQTQYIACSSSLLLFVGWKIKLL